MSHSFFATCPKNLEGILQDELNNLGAVDTKQTVAGVKFSGSLAIAYRACLWSRIANRVLMPLAEFNVPNANALYEGAMHINWLDHLGPSSTLLIDFSGTSLQIKNSHFGALKVKDAIVDQIRTKTKQRPNIAKENPDIRVNVYLRNNIATISIDLSGESLHRRGYRSEAGVAPLKENLAAAVLVRAGWPEVAKQNKPLLDPMCGSGTILIEAAMIAQDYAPGLLRRSFGFTKWRGHQPKIWQEIWREAEERRSIGASKPQPEIRGYDSNPRVIAAARQNIVASGFEKFIDATVKELSKFTPPTHHGNQYGIIVTNPPYGERLGEEDELTLLYREFGTILRERFQGWEAAMLTGNPELGKTMGIRAAKQYNFFNGAIPCKLLMFHVSEEWFVKGQKLRIED